MPKMVVLSQAGKELHEITLADTVFGIEPNQQCIFDAKMCIRDRYGSNLSLRKKAKDLNSLTLPLVEAFLVNTSNLPKKVCVMH